MIKHFLKKLIQIPTRKGTVVHSITTVIIAKKYCRDISPKNIHSQLEYSSQTTDTIAQSI